MHVVCSYCKKVLPDKEPLDDLTTSHSMCLECHEYFMPQYRGLTVSGYLERFPNPVLVGNSEGRIIAANSKAFAMTGRTPEDIGLLGGEFMECAYARLPEGCGKTIHCKSCTIRNAVNKALVGEDQEQVPAYLVQSDRKLFFLISTTRIGDYIRISVDEAREEELELPNP